MPDSLGGVAKNGERRVPFVPRRQRGVTDSGSDQRGDMLQGGCGSTHTVEGGSMALVSTFSSGTLSFTQPHGVFVHTASMRFWCVYATYVVLRHGQSVGNVETLHALVCSQCSCSGSCVHKREAKSGGIAKGRVHTVCIAARHHV